MRKLADHIRQAHEDAEKVRISSDKITKRFNEIERVELDAPEHLKHIDANMVAPETDEQDSIQPVPVKSIQG